MTERGLSHIEFARQEKTIEIKKVGNEQKFTILDVVISHEKPLKLEFDIQKQPIYLKEGDQTDFEGVIVDHESEKVKSLLEESRLLKNLPEKERLHRVMELVRSNLKFPFKEELEEIGQETYNQVEEGSLPIRLSKLVELGYGQCRHFAPLYLVLAQEAGLEGQLASGDKLINIIRTDNNKPLFKSVKPGESVASHQWVSIILKNGDWITVDPTKNLIADNQKALEMVTKANYQEDILGSSNSIEAPPNIHFDDSGMFFRPNTGEIKTDMLVIRPEIKKSLHGFRDRNGQFGYVIKKEKIEEFRGDLDLSAIREFKKNNIDIKSVRVVQ